jgi:hypothetical protein
MNTRQVLAAAAAILGSAGLLAAPGHSADAAQKPPMPVKAFSMVRSTGTPDDCLPDARARVKIFELEGAEKMVIKAHGLKPRTEFDMFVIQVPNAPFGMSWYQGDVETDKWGNAEQTFIGRFNEETFSVAPGTAPAPVVHDDPIADASSNPATAPLHQYHLGLWFNSPNDAEKAGCLPNVTPFNGEHNAGVQILSTRQFGDANGPLRHIKS